MWKFALAVLLKGKQFFSSICSREVLNSFLLIRVTAAIVIFALVAPMYYFGNFGKTKAQTNLPIPQPVPASAPPEPYLISSPAFNFAESPTFQTIVNPISNSYSSVATFLGGAETPEGLGAATPPPTFSERFSGFFASIFPTTEIISNSSPLPSCSHLAFDFDGDCLADYSRWQANSFQYKIYNSGSSDYTTLNLGASNSKIAPADSSYAQVKVNNPGTSNSPTPIEDITLTVSGTDGTQLAYSWIGGAYRCTRVTDRNGNYITISNNSDGQLTSPTRLTELLPSITTAIQESVRLRRIGKQIMERVLQRQHILGRVLPTPRKTSLRVLTAICRYSVRQMIRV